MSSSAEALGGGKLPKVQFNAKRVGQGALLTAASVEVVCTPMLGFSVRIRNILRSDWCVIICRWDETLILV